MGLGFSGWYQGQPEYLRKKSLEVSARIRPYMDADSSARICPEAYEHVNTSDLVEPPGKRLVLVMIALVGLAAVVFVANIVAYRDSRGKLADALDEIRNSPAGQGPAGRAGPHAGGTEGGS